MTVSETKKKTRNVTPKIDCPHVAIMTRPHSTQSSCRLAARTTAFIEQHTAWKADVRKAFADGKDLPVFPASKIPNPNTGITSRSAYEKMVDSFNDEGGNDFPPSYNPVLVDLVHRLGCASLRRGSVKNHSAPPADWNEEEYGSWYHTDVVDGETVQTPSGWYFDSKPPRHCHAKRAEMLIDEPDKNILVFDGVRYVVGTGTHDGAACFLIWQTKGGDYRLGDEARKRMSLAGNKDVRNVVFRIEDTPTEGGGVVVQGRWDGISEMVYLPGQVLTAGCLHNDDGVMTAKDIRGLSDDVTGLKFVPLSAPIVGKAVAWSKLWAEISRHNGGGGKEIDSIRNICVNGKRVDPGEFTPFGLRGSQCDMPAYLVASGTGKVEEGHFSMGVVIGSRSNVQYNVSVGEARAAAAEKKTTKKKSKKVVAEPDATDDAAPPIEADTANEVEAEVTPVAEVVEAEVVEAEVVEADTETNVVNEGIRLAD